MGGFFSLPSFGQGVGQVNAGGVLGGGLGAAAGGFPTSSTTTGHGTTTSNQSGSVTPTMDPATQKFLEQLMGQYTNFMNQNYDLAPYQAQQSNIINQNANSAQKNIDANLAARGLSRSPVAASIAASGQVNRTNQLSSLAQSIPLLAKQLQASTLSQANNFFSSIPKGQSSTSSGTSTTDQTQTTKSGGGIGGVLAGLGGLASMFSDERLKKDIVPINAKDSIKLLSKLEPTKWNWKETEEPGHGFIAQKFEKVLPASVIKDSTGFRRLDIIQVIPHLVAAVNKLSQKKAA